MSRPIWKLACHPDFQPAFAATVLVRINRIYRRHRLRGHAGHSSPKLWRHGLFSAPASHAIGETNKYRPIVQKVDKESGEHLWEANNMLTGPLKRGPAQYMSDPSFPCLALKDPYVS